MLPSGQLSKLLVLERWRTRQFRAAVESLRTPIQFRHDSMLELI